MDDVNEALIALEAYYHKYGEYFNRIEDILRDEYDIVLSEADLKDLKETLKCWGEL